MVDNVLCHVKQNQQKGTLLQHSPAVGNLLLHFYSQPLDGGHWLQAGYMASSLEPQLASAASKALVLAEAQVLAEALVLALRSTSSAQQVLVSELEEHPWFL